MRVLGISCYFHDAAAALIEDGQLVRAAEEERFTRKKHDYSFPTNAIDFCLGSPPAPPDLVVFFEKPFLKFERLLCTNPSYRLFVQSMRAWLFDKLWIRSRIASYLKLPTSKILFSEHHLSHAASTYFCSPYTHSAVVTMDGVGEWATTSIGVGEGSSLKILEELHFPHSIGLFYSVFTAFLGFEVNEGEYKVMGMASYGKPIYEGEVCKVVQRHGDGSFELNLDYFAFHRSTTRLYTSKFLALFGQPRIPESEFVGHYANLAASVQKVTEELVLGVVRRAYELVGGSNLCLAGGVAYNSAANGRIQREGPFKNLFIQPAAGDSGGALGAALLGAGSPHIPFSHTYYGLNGGSGEPDLGAIAGRLASGKVVGWLQGRAEWGPRALGNRSILADPRNESMKDVVNSKIKFREPFRPFAPSVLQEHAEEYFDLPEAHKNLPAKYMLLVVPVKEEVRSRIEAVSHMGTSRIQVVDKETNPLYYALIKAFYERTGCPMLLNTSFNLRGEPIVNTVEDAVRTFERSGLDVLAVGGRIWDRK